MICSNVKKAFGSLPLFDGRVDKYDDWRFKVITVFEMEDNFRELLEWTEKLTKMPEQEDLDEWEFEQKKKRERFLDARPTLSCSLSQSQR